MRGTKAKTLRRVCLQFGNPETTYKRHPHTGAIHLDPACSRAVYQEAKKVIKR